MAGHRNFSQGRGQRRKAMRNFKTTFVLLVVFLVWASLAGGIHVYIESLWFESLGYWDVFFTLVFSRLKFFLLGAVCAFALLAFNLWLSSRRSLGSFWFRPELNELAQRGTRLIFYLAGLGISVLAGIAIQANWMS